MRMQRDKDRLKTADAKPGKYEVLRWTKTLIQDAGCGFEFADGVGSSLWSFDFNTADRALYLTLKDPTTLLMVR